MIFCTILGSSVMTRSRMASFLVVKSTCWVKKIIFNTVTELCSFCWNTGLLKLRRPRLISIIKISHQNKVLLLSTKFVNNIL